MVASCLLLSGCAEYRDGDSMARDIAAAEAERLVDDLGHRNRVRDAEYIAATGIPKAAQGGSSPVRIEALAWSGRTAPDEQAIIDVRIAVTVTEDYGSSFGDRGHSAGQATRCYRYRLALHRATSRQEIDCPAVATPPVPTAVPIPALPDDARDRLTGALRTATPDTLAGAVRAAFPEKHVTVDTVTHEGALVAAVGVPAELDCLLLVRTPAGAIESPGYDPNWLEPGETGCRTGLYVSPPR
ncbi:hypothetical protein JNW91_06025 [Micromonospora sp. STR1_7]|uniref:Uncharacterized protein n=2 Tax=Micromonospora parastrephiae TaxID=2806101 RepID=A0ABS1XQC4_9ACTN|nr:hypothetical protein [Micromonospora parastrephiae]